MASSQHREWYKALTKLLMQDVKQSNFQVPSQVFHRCLKNLGMSFGHPIVDDIMLKCVIQANGDVNFRGLIGTLESATPEKRSVLHKRPDNNNFKTQQHSKTIRSPRNQQSSMQHLLDHSSHHAKSTQNSRKFDTIRGLLRELDLGTLSCNDFLVGAIFNFYCSIMCLGVCEYRNKFVRFTTLTVITIVQSKLAGAGIKLTPEAKRLLEKFEKSGKISFTRFIRSFESSFQVQSVREHSVCRRSATVEDQMIKWL